MSGGFVGVGELDLFCAAYVCAGDGVPYGAGVESAEVECGVSRRECRGWVDEESGVGLFEVEFGSLGDVVCACPACGEADDEGVACELDD